jgi:hypothetical protein
MQQIPTSGLSVESTGGQSSPLALSLNSGGLRLAELRKAADALSG